MEIKLEKVVLNIGGVDEILEKGVILLEKISGNKAVKVKATKRIPTWKVRPGLEVGTKVTLRGEEALAMVKKLLPHIALFLASLIYAINYSLAWSESQPGSVQGLFSPRIYTLFACPFLFDFCD